jgi:hypothetical protein
VWGEYGAWRRMEHLQYWSWLYCSSLWYKLSTIFQFWFFKSRNNFPSVHFRLYKGLGAVGLAIIQGAKARQASRIFAVDINPAKFAIATQLGATDCINSLELPEGTSIQSYIVAQTTWGVDYSFDATGNVKVMRAALECAHRGDDRLYAVIIRFAWIADSIDFFSFDRLGSVLRGRSSAFWPWDLHKALPTYHWSGLERYRIRRLQISLSGENAMLLNLIYLKKFFLVLLVQIGSAISR